MSRPRRLHFLTGALVALLLLAPLPTRAEVPTIITDIPRDIGASFTGVPLLIWIGGAVTAAETFPFDSDIQQHFQTPHLGKFDDVCDILGGPYVIDAGAVVVYGIGAIAKLPEVKNTGEALVEALVLTEATTAALKFSINRTRPNGGRWSFPSAHASRSFAVAAVLARLHGLPAAIPAYLAAAAITYTRLDSNVHFASDLIFGAALGSAIGFGTAKIHFLREKNMVLLPTVMGGGPGLSFAMAF